MFMFDFNAAKPQRGFGPHPGPAPKWRPYGEFYRFHACEHTQRKPVWRVYGDGTRRYGFQCLDCGDWGMRDGKIHGTQHWLGPKKFWAETRINPYGSEPADESFRDTRRAEITR